MSIQLCSHCKLPYWRFRGDHPPRGVCSVLCNDARKAGEATPTPRLPSEILWEIREHRRDIHQCTDILVWFECETCEELEARYGDSLEYHYDRITRDIVKEARV